MSGSATSSKGNGDQTIPPSSTTPINQEFDLSDREEFRRRFAEMNRILPNSRARISRNKKIIQRNLSQLNEHCEVNIGCSPSLNDLAYRRPSEMESGSAKDDTGWDTDLEMEDAPESYDHSGKTAYIKACHKSNVVPVSYYLRHMQDSELRLRHHQLGANGVKPIAISLVSNAKILSLDLSDNWLSYDGASVICDMLRENCFITHLNLSENHLGPESAEMLSHILMTTISLTHVTLSANAFDDQSAVFFSEALMNTTKIEYLNLSHNHFCEAAGVTLGPAIAENSSLKELDLSWNCLRRKGAVAIALGVKNNIMIKRLNLSWNGFGVDGCRELGKALQENTTLEEIDLTNNRITTEAAVLFGKGVAVSESVHTIKIGKNPMQSAGCWAICSAVLKNSNCLFKELDFEDIMVNKDFKDIRTEVKNLLPDIKINHGGLAPPPKPKARLHPMVKLQNYITKHNLKLIDFFQKFDKDGSMSVNYEEFAQGLDELGIQLLEDEVAKLISELDKDGDGEINYSELVIGNQEFTENEKKSGTAQAFQTAGTTQSILRSS